MPKINLDQQYLWGGVYYGPGEAEVPESMVSAYNLTATPMPPEEPPKTKAKTTTKPVEE